VAIKPTSITIADVTGDNDFDLVVTFERIEIGEPPDHVDVFTGTDGRFPARPTDYTVGESPQRAVADDFNGDAIPDIVTVNYFGDTVSLLVGRRAADFEPATDFRVGGIGPTDIAVADFDGDGRLDLMTVNFNTADLSVLVNTGDYPVIPGDVDADRRLTRTDIDRIIAEIFDGDGDSPLDTRYGFTASVGTIINANRDPLVNCADVPAVLRARVR
jgi:hypothetical protein